MAYAQGKNALGVCDRCGQNYKLNTLRKEWTGFKVCIECYEAKHPQLLPKRNISDAIAVKDARPDQPRQFTVSAQAPGASAFSAVGMQPAPVAQRLNMGGAVGSVTITIT